MKIHLYFISAGILVCACILSAKDGNPAQRLRTEPHAAVPAAGQAAKDSGNDCLNCHGPFDKLIEASAKYVAPSGEKTSPHRYVPHDSKKQEDIPECTHCHTAHPLDPLPKQGSIDISKVNVQWCYDACHHESNFTPCNKCHP